MARLLFEDLDRWAEVAPDSTAIHALDGAGADDVISYAELSGWSSRIAAVLSAHGVVIGDRVAICMPKGTAAIAAMLGVSKAGAAYVPLDPESPPERIRLILEAADPRAVLADRASFVSGLVQARGRSGTFTGTLDSVDSTWPVDPAFSKADVAAADSGFVPPSDIDPGDLAHLLFTSGSTGAPKGVSITHANVSAFVDWGVAHFGYSQADNLSGHSPLHFDLSTFDIYGTFAAGATLHPVPKQININPIELVRWINDRSLTQWFSVPSALNHMVRFDAIAPGDFPELRRLIWCGEVMPTPTLIELMEKLPHVDFTNLYGPTEATIASSWYHVPSVPTDPTEPVPIGRACADEQLWVLDERGHEAEDGVVGDLYIEGVGLSPGYWRDEEKTAAAFRTDLVEGRRLYKTGDLAYRRADGELVFVGRADNQIKSRGHRIELGEIESALRTVDSIEDSAVIAIDSGDLSDVAICAAYVSGSGPKPAVIAKQLSTRVPRYMLPHRWMRLDELPKNVNGKVDRPTLQEWFLNEENRASLR